MMATFENLRQAKEEDLMKFADRARSLLHDLNLAYKPLTNQMKTENDKRVARCFVRGINNNEVKRLIPLGVISNLDDSIAQVLNLEANTGSNVATRDLFCQTCKSVGHRESSCRLKNRDTNELLTSLLLSMSTRQSNNSTNRNGSGNNRPRMTNYFANPNNGQFQNRNNFNNVPSQMNNNNQSQNRGNFNNHSSQTNNQQQNSRNRPMGANNNIRNLNADEVAEDNNHDQLGDYDDGDHTDLTDEYDQTNFFQEYDSGN